MDRGFKIMDANGRRAGMGTYIYEYQAELEIAEWLRRQARGGRPDLSRTWLLGLHAVPEDGKLND